MVNNMTKGMAMKLGNQFQQESIVFGERFDDGDKVGMTFQLIITYNCTGDAPVGTVVGERKVFIGRQDENDFYTEVKGRKFQIPFFDVEHEVERKDDKGNTVLDDEGKPKMDVVGRTEYDKASWDGGKIAGSVYVPTDITPEDDKQISEWIKTSLNENLTEKAQWMRRGMIINLLKKYF
jgi:methenyltetrahydromethanopterin cyclohydrolase